MTLNVTHRESVGPFVLALLLLVITGCDRFVTVTVTNATERPISQIQIDYSGGTATIGALQPRHHGIARIKPSGESSLRVRYVDATGVAHFKDADIYLEPGYSGTITAHIGSNGDVRFESRVDIP